jgi:hypothetical protein
MAKKLGSSSDIYDRKPTLNEFVKMDIRLAERHLIKKMEFLSDWKKYVVETESFRIWIAESSLIGKFLTEEIYGFKPSKTTPALLLDLYIEFPDVHEPKKWHLLVEDDEPLGTWVDKAAIQEWLPIADLKTADLQKLIPDEPIVNRTRRGKKTP